MGEQLFVYGTLKDPAVQQAVFGRMVEGQPARLDGYTKGQIELSGTVYGIIRPDLGSSVEGLLIEVTREELALIDRYEGDDYQRFQVTLNSGQTAWVYGKPG
jgi:gamma-glutamylcyclotransferase (GGCT)/AIG2-like uncharacterized protein YtfP